MPLCGSDSGCSCALSSAPALTGAVDGELPTITVSGTGVGADPWQIALNPDWAAAVAAATLPAAWTAASLSSPWVNFGGTSPVAAYRKRGDMVGMRGTVRTGTAGSVIFTLPVGYRPPFIQRFENEASAATGAFSVDTNGEVRSIRPTTPTAFELTCSFSITA